MAFASPSGRPLRTDVIVHRKLAASFIRREHLSTVWRRSSRQAWIASNGDGSAVAANLIPADANGCGRSCAGLDWQQPHGPHDRLA
jgi:hypothetical protein